jgi:carbonic anhydrase
MGCAQRGAAPLARVAIVRQVDFYVRPQQGMEEENRPIWNGRWASSLQDTTVYYLSDEEKRKYWNYDRSSLKGPSHWSHLDRDYILCEKGKLQSPVSLWTKQAQYSPFIKKNAIHLIESGHTFEVVDLGQHWEILFSAKDSRPRIEIRKEIFDVKKIIFKNPSDHELDGKKYPMELQILYGDQSEDRGFISIFVKEGTFHSELQKMMENVPLPHMKIKKSESTLFHVSHIFPYKLSYLSYEGSETYPPCREGYEWLVLLAPIEISKEQLKFFSQTYRLNNRPIQILNQRQVTKILSF